MWLVFLVLGPAGLTIGLATRPSYGSRVALATIATLGAVGYLAEALVGDELFGVDGSLWQLTAVAHMVLAAVAWWSVAASIRRDDPALLFDAA